jgi:hypothetical protein
MKKFLNFLIGWVVLAIACCQPQQAVGQRIEGSLPAGAFYQYVEITNFGISATHVQTKRLRQNKTEFVDIINLLADNSLIPYQTQGSLSTPLDGPHNTDQLLVTMAVLPDRATGLVTWEPLAPDSLRTKPSASVEAVFQDCYARIFAYKAGQPYPNYLTRRLDLRPIVRRAGRYWTTRNTVLTEYFLVRNQPRWFADATDNVTLNYKARVFSRADFAALTRQLALAFPKEAERPILAGELQTRLLLEKKAGTTYTFWSIPPHVTDAGLTFFGAGEVQFRPDVGVVSGKYATYFDLNRGCPNKYFF